MDQALEVELGRLGRFVPFALVTRVSTFEERRSMLEPRTSNIVGVSNGGVEFCPNDDPPSLAESLAFLWLVRPDLSEQILAETRDLGVREIILEYQRTAARGE